MCAVDRCRELEQVRGTSLRVWMGMFLTEKMGSYIGLGGEHLSLKINCTKFLMMLKITLNNGKIYACLNISTSSETFLGKIPLKLWLVNGIKKMSYVVKC